MLPHAELDGGDPADPPHQVLIRGRVVLQGLRADPVDRQVPLRDLEVLHLQEVQEHVSPTGGWVDKCLLEAGVLDVRKVLDVHDEFVVLLDQAQGYRIEGADMML